LLNLANTVGDGVFLTKNFLCVPVCYPDETRPCSSDISVTETITETEIVDPALTETETMLIYETEII